MVMFRVYLMVILTTGRITPGICGWYSFLTTGCMRRADV
jgi:hypothetical protein